MAYEDKVAALISALKRSGDNSAAAAKEIGINDKMAQRYRKQAIEEGLYVPNRNPQPDAQDVEFSHGAAKDKSKLKDAIAKTKLLEQQLMQKSEEMEAIDEVRAALSNRPNPTWMTDYKKAKGVVGIPTLFISDVHCGEVVRPEEIHGINEYNANICVERLEHVTRRSVDLIQNHLVGGGNLPGICLLLGGDMVSGDIHDELSATNDLTPLEAIPVLYDSTIKMIDYFLSYIPKVVVFCVTGNHGRFTKKNWCKGRNKRNADWLLYAFLAKHYAKDKRVQVNVADGPDIRFRLYDHRYLLTHGDQFWGGDGMIGALGPMARGDMKKRNKMGTIDQGYDTLLMGHWHQYMSIPNRFITNGTPKGYDEYANTFNFKPERPQQALWMTHPENGITFQMPVFCDDPKKIITPTTNWVSWEK